MKADEIIVKCPKCGQTKLEEDYEPAIRQGRGVVDVGFKCDCGKEFGFEVFE